MEDFLLTEKQIPLLLAECDWWIADKGHAPFSTIERHHLLQYLKHCMQHSNTSVQAIFKEEVTAEYAWIDITLETMRMWFWELYEIELFVDHTKDGFRFFGSEEYEREYIAKIRDRAHSL